MGVFRILVTVIRIIHKVITLLPKLQKAIKNEKDPQKQARIQQQLLHEELSQIPEYRDLIKKHGKKKTQAHVSKQQLRQEMIASIKQRKLRQDSSSKRPYKKPLGKPIVWHYPESNLHPEVQTALAPSKDRVISGYEDYPLLHELLSS